MPPKANQAAREEEEQAMPKSREKLQERVEILEEKLAEEQQRNQILSQLYQDAKQRVSMLANDMDAHEHRANNVMEAQQEAQAQDGQPAPEGPVDQ